MKGSASTLDIAVGWRVRTLRERSGITQAEMARQLGISFQQLQKYESGKNRISAGRLKVVAELLDLPVETFFSAEDESHTHGAGAYPSIKDFRDSVESLELVRSFRRIQSTPTRDRVLALVKTLAEEERKTTATAFALARGTDRGTEYGNNVVERDFAVAERKK